MYYMTPLQIAKKIHRNYYSIDSHTDTPLFFELGYDFGKKNTVWVTPEFLHDSKAKASFYEVKVDAYKMAKGLMDAVCMVAFIRQGELTDEASQYAVNHAFEVIKGIKQQIKQNETVAAQAVTSADIRKNKAEGKKSILIGIENGYAIGKDIANIERFANEGVVYITLCHNGSNDICDTAIGLGKHNGLSAFGKSVVREMNRCGIMVDISHTSEKASFDALEVSDKPVIASHSSVKMLCPHPRNVSDELLMAIAENGGVVQVCLYSLFLRNDEKATYRDVADHICYIVDKVGADYAGIGSDFDGCDDSAQLQGIHEIIKITEELVRRGMKEEDIGKILGGNLMRVLDKIPNH